MCITLSSYENSGSPTRVPTQNECSIYIIQILIKSFRIKINITRYGKLKFYFD